MTWAKLTHERTMKVYKEMLGDFVIKANSNLDLKVKEILIRTETQKRDFTKRQLNILSTIIALSFNFGKETAVLKPTDFSLTGVPAKKIAEELNKLISLKVIEWNKDFNEFKVTEPMTWEAPYHSHYDDKRSQELFFINLRHAGVDVTPIVEAKKKMGY